MTVGMKENAMWEIQGSTKSNPRPQAHPYAPGGCHAN